MNLAASAIRASERLLRGTTFDPVNIRSVLVLEYMLPLGCCVHLTPLYEAIKRARPEVAITVATRGIGAGLLRHHRFIDHLIETPDPFVDLRGAARGLRAELARRGLRPDCTLTGVADQRSRIALLGLLAGGGWRAGFTQMPGLYHRPLEREMEVSHIGNNLRLAELLGCANGHVEPRVFFSSADVSAMAELVKQANPDGRPLVVMVTQNSGGQRTGWHDDRFAQVIRHAHDVLGCAVVYVGTANDGAVVEHLRGEAGGIGTSLTGKTSVTELAALLAMSDAVVSLDTGTMHIGRAVGVPMAVIGPSWQRPVEWLPVGLPQVRILRGQDRDDVPANYRLDEVEAPEVIEALDNLLTTYPPRAESRVGRVEAGLSEIDHRRS
ncbi:MAG TPA: glycosyltransferase family 9 protein [Chthonomonadales bacterium]|nr:glycosyltransferase family 9 protein [Chthonomonadales bacterium]